MRLTGLPSCETVAPGDVVASQGSSSLCERGLVRELIGSLNIPEMKVLLLTSWDFTPVIKSNPDIFSAGIERIERGHD